MFTIEDVKNPIFGNAEKTFIFCEVKFEEFNDFLPFGASISDVEPHGVKIYNDLMAGKYGEIAPYVAPEPLPNQPVTTGTQSA